MSATHYSYTPQQLEEAYEKLEATLFKVKRDIGEDGRPTPKILVVAGVQGSGKTYMLNNTLLKDGGYANYVRLYDESFRELHPRYAEFADQDVLSRYKYTETFIWELCGRIYAHAYENKYNIIMETALDDRGFARSITGKNLADYQFEVHLIGCKQDFAHLSTINRALNALEKNKLERFVDIAIIEASLENAEAILDAFEAACMRVSGSTISMYERGFGELKNRRLLCRSRCDYVNSLTPLQLNDGTGQPIALERQTWRIERSELLPMPCSFANFIDIAHAPVAGDSDRREAWDSAYSALGRMRGFWEKIPPRVPDMLWGYIKKYTQ